LSVLNESGTPVLGWSKGEVDLTVSGEGEGELPANRQNRIVRGLVAALEAARGPLPERVGWRIAVRSEIPLARGLGSSAAATVAGLVAGNVLSGEGLTTADLLRLASEIEGHADNAAAALLGGFVVVGPAPDGDRLEAIRFDAPRDLRAILFIPERRLTTEEMRRVLPPSIPLADAVANLGRVALGVAGLAIGRTELLRVLTEDRLHEPYRATVFPELPRLTAAARAAGALGACLSGAGSTVVAFADSVASITRVEAALAAAAADLDLPGRLAVVAPRNVGATVVGRG
jgi:homoserine kinase